MENIKRQVSHITSPEAEVKARVNREAQDAQSPGKQYQPRFSRNRTKQEQEKRRRSSPITHQWQYCGYDHRKGDNCPSFGKNVGNAIKKIIFPQYADTQATRELIPRSKAIDKITKEGKSNGPLRRIHQSVQTTNTLYRRLQTVFKPRKLQEYKHVNKL